MNDESMDVDPSPDYNKFTTTSFRNYQISRLSEFQKLDTSQKLEVNAYMDSLETMSYKELQEALQQQKKIALKARLAYDPRPKEKILESGKLRIVEAVIKNKFSDGLPKINVNNRKVPYYLHEELLPQLDAYQKTIESLSMEDLLKEKEAQTIRDKNATPDRTPFDKKTNLESAKLEATQEELKDRNSLKRKTLDHPSYPEAKMPKNSSTITTPEEQTTYERELAEQEKQTVNKPKGMRF